MPNERVRKPVIEPAGFCVVEQGGPTDGRRRQILVGPRRRLDGQQAHQKERRDSLGCVVEIRVVGGRPEDSPILHTEREGADQEALADLRGHLTRLGELVRHGFDPQ